VSSAWMFVVGAYRLKRSVYPVGGEHGSVKTVGTQETAIAITNDDLTIR